MAEFDSSLPVMTENDGDVVAQIGDGAIPSQKLGVDASGRITVKNQDGAGNSLTSQTNGSQQALDVIDQADGPAAPGTAAAFSQLAGGQYNATPPTVADTQQVALQVNSNGKLLVSTSNSDDHNYGAVGVNTLRTAAQIGNATGAADFNAGATGAQTLRVAANLAIGGSNVSGSNPVPVTISDSAGTAVNDYKAAADVASAGTDNHDYTVTAGKTLHLNQIESSASGKAKMIVSIETGVGTGTFVTKFVMFNSTADTNMQLRLANPIDVAAGVRVRVAMSNLDKAGFDLHSTICGFEV